MLELTLDALDENSLAVDLIGKVVDIRILEHDDLYYYNHILLSPSTVLV